MDSLGRTRERRHQLAPAKKTGFAVHERSALIRTHRALQKIFLLHLPPAQIISNLQILPQSNSPNDPSLFLDR
jgi:hypothetical protein